MRAGLRLSALGLLLGLTTCDTSGVQPADLAQRGVTLVLQGDLSRERLASVRVIARGPEAGPVELAPQRDLPFRPTQPMLTLELPELSAVSDGPVQLWAATFDSAECLMALGTAIGTIAGGAARVTLTLAKADPQLTPCRATGPVVTSFAPREAKTTSGASVTLQGFGLLPGTALLVGGAPANVPELSPDRLVAEAPARANPGEVPVTLQAPGAAAPLPVTGTLRYRLSGPLAFGEPSKLATCHFIAMGKLLGGAQAQLVCGQGDDKSGIQVFHDFDAGARIYTKSFVVSRQDAGIPAGTQTDQLLVAPLDQGPDEALVVTSIQDNSRTHLRFLARPPSGALSLIPGQQFLLSGRSVLGGRLGRPTLATGRFTADGQRDVAVGLNSPAVRLLRNFQGSISPDTAPIEGLGNYFPYVTTAADVNGDGWDDILTCNGGDFDNEVRIFLNRSGVFGRADASVKVKACAEVRAADLDHDGALDVVVADGALPTEKYPRPPLSAILLWLHKGQPTQLLAGPRTDVKLQGGAEPLSIALADLDDDGWIDIAASDLGAGVHVLRNNMGSFQEFPPIALPSINPTIRRVLAADVNGDGRLDLIPYADEVFVLLNQTP